MSRLVLSVMLVLFVAVVVPQVTADVYTGTLSSPDGGLTSPGGNWDPISITWTVSSNSDGSFHYLYDLSAARGISHVLLETSRTFTTANLLNYAGPVEIRLWEPGESGNPGLPDELYGIKFDDLGNETVHLAFDSRRRPVWGDIYLKDGNSGLGYRAWNAGFTASDMDPFDRPANGSVLINHVLVPDTVTTPEPGTLALLALGLGTAGGWWRRWRRSAG
jgi:hypothetical protein